MNPNERDPKDPGAMDLMRRLDREIAITSFGPYLTTFRNRLRDFVEGKVFNPKLYAGDFIDEDVADDERKLVISDAAHISINYVRARARFFTIVAPHIQQSEPLKATASVVFQGDTDKLKEIISKDPSAKLNLETTYYRFIPQLGSNARLVIDRYIDPQTKRPISEVWRCIKGEGSSSYDREASTRVDQRSFGRRF